MEIPLEVAGLLDMLGCAGVVLSGAEMRLLQVDREFDDERGTPSLSVGVEML